MKMPLKSWLDENIRDWQSMSDVDLYTRLQREWKAGKFKRLIGSTKANDDIAVRVGSYRYSYVVLD